MTCGYPNCINTATWLVKVVVRTRGPNDDLRIEFTPGIRTCAMHTPDITAIGPKMKEQLGVELDRLGGKRPYTYNIRCIAIDSAEAKAYFAAKGN